MNDFNVFIFSEITYELNWQLYNVGFAKLKSARRPSAKVEIEEVTEAK